MLVLQWVMPPPPKSNEGSLSGLIPPPAPAVGAFVVGGSCLVKPKSSQSHVATDTSIYSFNPMHVDRNPELLRCSGQPYDPPRARLLRFPLPLSILETVSLEGEIQDFEDGEDF